MEIQKSQKNLEKNQKKIKKKQILGCFLKILKIAKNPGFDSFLMFFDNFLILFGGNHGNPKIAKNPRKKSKKNKKIKKESKKKQILGCFLKILKIAKNPGFDSFLIFFDYFLIFFTFGFDHFLIFFDFSI